MCLDDADGFVVGSDQPDRRDADEVIDTDASLLAGVTLEWAGGRDGQDSLEADCDRRAGTFRGAQTP